MADHNRRHFLKISTTALAGIGLTAPLMILGGCKNTSTGPTQEEEQEEQKDKAGHWQVVNPVPVRSWSAALLPTGKVLLFQNGEQMYLWDPDELQFENLAPSNTELFCAGLAMLADGRLLAAGGHEDEDEDHFLGLESAEIFDPWEEQWTQVPDMTGGARWYPTAVTLPDGRVLVASGTHAGELNEVIELFDPALEEWAKVTSRSLPLYPWSAARPGGELAFYGPMSRTLYFNWENGSFREGTPMSMYRGGGSGTLLNGITGKLLAVGGGNPTTNTAEIYNPDTGQWQSIDSMSQPRHHPDLVLLPDGRVLVVGGHGSHDHDHEGNVLSAGIYDPKRNRWDSAGSANHGHGYHSTALLLPNGSVLAAGPRLTMEIYHPWYATENNRPAITDLPEQIGYDETFSVTTDGQSDIDRVVLIRTSSVTHSLNTDQRYLELEFEPNTEAELLIQGPGSPGIAPPGYYLLFIVTGEDIPSKGRFLRIG